MSGIDADVVRRVARLARVKLSDDELTLYRSQLGAVLGHMADLAALDTAGVAGTCVAPGLSNVLREDDVEPFCGREDLLGNAPEREGSYFKVRKVLP
ncbi:MAG: Asp-tRNA(Asn)/Glu-tRNA(Gln) amidotransferase subunit GatC [Elusimicrobiota bacterium]